MGVNHGLFISNAWMDALPCLVVCGIGFISGGRLLMRCSDFPLSRRAVVSRGGRSISGQMLLITRAQGLSCSGRPWHGLQFQSLGRGGGQHRSGGDGWAGGTLRRLHLRHELLVGEMRWLVRSWTSEILVAAAKVSAADSLGCNTPCYRNYN
jgi:hypothetical protein